MAKPPATAGSRKGVRRKELRWLRTRSWSATASSDTGAKAPPSWRRSSPLRARIGPAAPGIVARCTMVSTLATPLRPCLVPPLVGSRLQISQPRRIGGAAALGSPIHRHCESLRAWRPWPGPSAPVPYASTLPAPPLRRPSLPHAPAPAFAAPSASRSAHSVLPPPYPKDRPRGGSPTSFPLGKKRCFDF